MHSFTFLKQIFMLFSKVLYEYSCATLGIKIIEYCLSKSWQLSEKTALKSRFILLRLTAFPCFLDTATPILSAFEGKYNNVILGENTFFPLWNSGELLSALISSSLPYLSTCRRRHSLSETVNLASLSFFGLISPFHNYFYLLNVVFSQNTHLLYN